MDFQLMIQEGSPAPDLLELRPTTGDARCGCLAAASRSVKILRYP